MKMELVRFSTEDGVSLEGELRPAEEPVRGSAVICHADPRQGGSKDHPLLWAIRNELSMRGFTVLSFNFRGTMHSDGSYGGGRTEVRDLRAATGRVREESEGPTVVCGWSFGADVALREAVGDERVAALALVGLPLAGEAADLPALPTASELRAFKRPVLFVVGERDQICPVPELRALAERLPAGEVEVLAGTDHFLWRREPEVAALIGDFSARLLPAG